MKDPIDIADEVFILALQAKQQCDKDAEYEDIGCNLSLLAERLSYEVSVDHPLKLIWLGSTIQGIIECLSEAAERSLDLDNEELCGYFDFACDRIEEILYQTENEGEDEYVIGN